MKTQHYRHGDLTLHPCKEIQGKEVKHSGSFVLAEGETTGHKHTIVAEKPGDLVINQDKNGYYITLLSKGTITHEEHNTIHVEPGTYRMYNEREMDWFSKSVRKVID